MIPSLRASERQSEFVHGDRGRLVSPFTTPAVPVGSMVRIRDHVRIPGHRVGHGGELATVTASADRGVAVKFERSEGCGKFCSGASLFDDEYDAYDPDDFYRDAPWICWSSIDWLAKNVQVPGANWEGQGPRLQPLTTIHRWSVQSPESRTCIVPPGDQHWVVLGVDLRVRLRASPRHAPPSSQLRLVTGEDEDRGPLVDARLVHLLPRRDVRISGAPDWLEFRAVFVGWLLTHRQARGLTPAWDQEIPWDQRLDGDPRPES